MNNWLLIDDLPVSLSVCPWLSDFCLFVCPSLWLSVCLFVFFLTDWHLKVTVSYCLNFCVIWLSITTILLLIFDSTVWTTSFLLACLSACFSDRLNWFFPRLLIVTIIKIKLTSAGNLFSSYTTVSWVNIVPSNCLVRTQSFANPCTHILKPAIHKIL